MKRLGLCLILWAAPLAAQDPVFSPAATERCLRSGGGTAALACLMRRTAEQTLYLQEYAGVP